MIRPKYDLQFRNKITGIWTLSLIFGNLATIKKLRLTVGLPWQWSSSLTLLDAFHRRVGLGIGTSTADTLSLSAVIHLLKTMQAVGYDTALFRSVAILFLFWFGFCHILNLIQHLAFLSFGGGELAIQLRS